MADSFGVTPEQGEAYARAQHEATLLVGEVYRLEPEHYRAVAVDDDVSEYRATFMFAGEPSVEVVDMVKAAGHDISTGGLMSMDEMRALQRPVAEATFEVLRGVVGTTIEADVGGDFMYIKVPVNGTEMPLAELETRIEAIAADNYDGPFDLETVVSVVEAELAQVEDLTLHGGAKLYDITLTFRCTAGFSVQELNTNKKGVNTAGHCNGYNGEPFPDMTRAGSGQCPPNPPWVLCYIYNLKTPTTGNWDSSGGLVNSWWGDGTWRQYDGTNVSDDFYVTESILHDTQLAANYAQASQAGARCRFGRTTGGGGCGTIRNVDVCWVTNSGSYCNGTHINPTGACRGDSGGPWYSGGVAYGISSARFTLPGMATCGPGDLAGQCFNGTQCYETYTNVATAAAFNVEIRTS